MEAIGLRLHESLPVPLNPRDLIDVGIRGLLVVAAEYRRYWRAPFPTYVNHCLRGAMLDWLRDNGAASRDLGRLRECLQAADRQQDT